VRGAYQKYLGVGSPNLEKICGKYVTCLKSVLFDPDRKDDQIVDVVTGGEIEGSRTSDEP